ncbi:MAG: LamG domain-containing protein, partial [Candidatus Marinimicrobia bacterium]|nr:LamG domain-containing protein [Candidatus Neomarinimicrobiota bacterium]
MKKLLISLLFLLGAMQAAWGQISGSYLSDGGSFAIFDGTNDHLQITPAEMGTAFQFTGSFSMEAWVYREDWSVTPASNQSILSYTQFGGYALQLRSSGNLAFKVYSSTAEAYEYTEYAYTGLSAGWHHIAVVRITNPSASHRLYIDGSQVATSSGSGGTLDYRNDNYFEIGAESHDSSAPESGHYFEGAIDEVRIWDALLGGTEISDWMYKIITSSDRPSYYADLVGYYKLDTDWPSEYGGFLDDASGNVGGSGDYDLTGSNYTTDNAPRLIDGHYRVGHLDHLVWMSVSSGSRLDYTYKQANNIDASASASLNSGEGFNP